MSRPLMEYSILNVLNPLRPDQQKLREDITLQLTHKQLGAANRALLQTTDTINNVLFIITATASLFVFVGWNSLRDIKNKVKGTVSDRVGNITEEYEHWKKDSKSAQKKFSTTNEKITITNEIHSLWIRANLESDMHGKIEMYNEILRRHPDDVEALV